MLDNIRNLSRPVKWLIFLIADTALIPISLYFAFSLKYGEVTPFNRVLDSWLLFLVLTCVGSGLIYFMKLPKIKLNAFEAHAMLRVGLVAALLSLSALAISYSFQLTGARSIPIIFGTIFFLLSVSMRGFGLYFLYTLPNLSNTRLPVIIYGGGSAGIQLASALRLSNEARPVAFIDDNPNLSGLMIAGLPIHPRSKLETLIKKFKVERVLVAMPSISIEQQNKIVSSLSSLPVEVQILPSYSDMIARNGMIDSLHPVPPDELLGRDKVDLDILEIAKTYAGRVVMVTGAGGSIGSELCRQLLSCRPAQIVLFEQGEYQLYSIDRNLSADALAAGIKLSRRLGSVINKASVTDAISEFNVEIILHAAAYKHVPLVEENELAGARNNVIGTQVVAEAAAKANIERFILLSTDKAVRPTNIMGATKRMAELVVQDIQTRSKRTKFSMVRFGNVLGSSGSVLPLFQKQIEAGGPVTVTHPEVTRFFMAIPESARLVLLAGAFAQGGDVFVLDMGKPQKIIDIARKMITLSGRKVVADEKNGDGISITFTGLRPGEKMYEELLLNDNSLLHTPHPKILRAQESMLSQIEVAAMLNEVKNAIAEGNKGKLRRLISKRIDGYHQALNLIQKM